MVNVRGLHSHFSWSKHDEMKEPIWCQAKLEYKKREKNKRLTC